VTHGSLFSGIGGFDLAASWCGIETLWQVEIDEYCRRVLEKHFPEAKRYGDIRTVRGAVAHADEGGRSPDIRETLSWRQGTEETNSQLGGRGQGGSTVFDQLPAVDIISGGFPCQPFSVAGKRKGREDDRFLWPEMLRVIREVQPSWVIAENVGGLLTQENGVVFEHCLSDLEAAGYEVQPFVIPACAVNAPHRRDRVWIVGHASREGSQGGKQRGTFGEGTRAPRSAGEPSQNVADGDIRRCEQCQPESERGISEPDTISGRFTKSHLGQLVDGLSSGLAGWWDREPEIPRVATGVKDRVNKLKALGNAIVPAVAYQIFRAIVEIENEKSRTQQA